MFTPWSGSKSLRFWRCGVKSHILGYKNLTESAARTFAKSNQQNVINIVKTTKFR